MKKLLQSIVSVLMKEASRRHKVQEEQKIEAQS